jgi:hypothetical protein
VVSVIGFAPLRRESFAEFVPRPPRVENDDGTRAFVVRAHRTVVCDATGLSTPWRQWDMDLQWLRASRDLDHGTNHVAFAFEAVESPVDPGSKVVAR